MFNATKKLLEHKRVRAVPVFSDISLGSGYMMGVFLL